MIKLFFYFLKAQDAKERQHWVNILRLVAHSKEDDKIKVYKPDQNESFKSNNDLKK